MGEASKTGKSKVKGKGREGNYTTRGGRAHGGL